MMENNGMRDIVERLETQAFVADKTQSGMAPLFEECLEEITRLRAENEQLRKDLKTAIMGDSAELQDVKRENEKLREVLIAAMIREHQAYLTCEDIVHNYDWELDLEQTDIVGLIENMRHTIKGARDRAINDNQYRILNAFYIKNAGVSGWWEKQDLRAAAAAIME